MHNSFKQYSDAQLYQKCLDLSEQIKNYRNQFIALLPEVYARKLYLKHRMHSVYEFGAKLAGLSNQTVDKILRINQRLKKMPLLKQKFLDGDIAWTKLEVVSALLVPENDYELSQKLPTLSVGAARLFMKQSKLKSGETLKNPKKQTELLSVKLSLKTMTQLKIYKSKIQKEKGHLITWDIFFEEILTIAKTENSNLNCKTVKTVKTDKTVKTVKTDRVNRANKTDKVNKINKIDKTKQADIVKSTDSSKNISLNNKPIPTENNNAKSRYIPAKIRKQVLATTQELCSKCNNPAEVLHHNKPFAIHKSHSDLMPLCHAHHDLEHHKTASIINKKYQKFKSRHKKKRLATNLSSQSYG